MNETRLHSALREMRRHFADPRVLTGMAVVALIMGFAGPFGTYAALETVPRLVYWGVMVVATYGIGFAVRLLAHDLETRLRHPLARAIVLGGFIGLPVTATAIGINAIALGPTAWQAIDPVTLWFNVTLIAMGVVLISVLIQRSIAPPAPPALAAPALLERLPLPQRGPLLSLSVADHYVEVTTEKGRSLLLIRLSDAIREAHPTVGLQIHRSHWVALDAVARTIRVDGKLLVELKDGRRLPISRSYADPARAAGLTA